MVHGHAGAKPSALIPTAMMPSNTATPLKSSPSTLIGIDEEFERFNLNDISEGEEEGSPKSAPLETTHISAEPARSTLP